jgi:UDP-GlcNAc:undecaprenyl-phosphate GlcNAc-1-phosphate transferase
MGFSTRKAVYILYTATLLLCLSAILLVNIRHEEVGLLLVILGALCVVFLRSLGFLGFVDKDRMQSWLKDFSFVTGVSRDRRRFLDLQLAIGEAKSLEELWTTICKALQELDMDYGEMALQGEEGKTEKQKGGLGARLRPRVRRQSEQDMAGQTFRRSWTAEGCDLEACLHSRSLFKLELPLFVGRRHVGDLWLLKDIIRSPLNHYTLSRIEHLRRSVSKSLERLATQDRAGSGYAPSSLAR